MTVFLDKKPASIHTSAPQPEYLDIRGAGHRLGLCVTVIRKMIREDPSFPAKKLLGSWRVRTSDLDAWFDKQPGKAGAQ